MNAKKLSPVARLLMSLSLVIGILVVDQACPLFSRAALAQSGIAMETNVSDVPVGTTILVTNGVILGTYVPARQVIVNGTPVDAAFADGVKVRDSIVMSGNVLSINGVIVSGEKEPGQSAIVSGDLVSSPSSAPSTGEGTDVTPEGVIVSGEVVSSEGVIVSGECTILGGTVVGNNVQVVDGIIHGDNLTVVGATIVGTGFTVSGVTASVAVGQ